MSELIFNNAIFSEIEKKPITNDSTAKVVTKKYDDRPSDEEIADDVIHMGKEGYGYGEDREDGGDYEVDWVKRDEKVNNSRRTIKSSLQSEAVELADEFDDIYYHENLDKESLYDALWDFMKSKGFDDRKKDEISDWIVVESATFAECEGDEQIAKYRKGLMNNSRRTIKSSISLPSKPYGKYGLKLGKQTGNGHYFNTYSVKTSDGDVVGAIEFHCRDVKKEYCVAWNYNGYSGMGAMSGASMYTGKTKPCDTVEECFEFIEREIDDGNNIVMNKKLNNSRKAPNGKRAIKSSNGKRVVTCDSIADFVDGELGFTLDNFQCWESFNGLDISFSYYAWDEYDVDSVINDVRDALENNFDCYVEIDWDTDFEEAEEDDDGTRLIDFSGHIDCDTEIENSRKAPLNHGE